MPVYPSVCVAPTRFFSLRARGLQELFQTRLLCKNLVDACDVLLLELDQVANRGRSTVFAAVIALTAFIGSASLPSQAVAGPVRAGSVTHGVVAAKHAFACSRFYYCDYIYDYGTGLCFKAGTFSGPGNLPNWGKYGCRNVDGSFFNNSPFTVRIYYAPHYGDPHACIKPFTKIKDLFNYDFNSGRGPHNLVIGNDIASSKISLSPCTNPI